MMLSLARIDLTKLREQAGAGDPDEVIGVKRGYLRLVVDEIAGARLSESTAKRHEAIAEVCRAIGDGGSGCISRESLGGLTA